MGNLVLDQRAETCGSLSPPRSRAEHLCPMTTGITPLRRNILVSDMSHRLIALKATLIEAGYY